PTIKEIKDPRKTYTLSIFISMILALIIFMVGTLIIAAVNPNKDINVLYTLYATYKTLGSTIGIPWLYMIFVYAGLGATIANLVTNLAGPP
ncbi:amino acid-polyamine-organocation transporter, glutamate:gamma-aminobutyrate antiporter, partial [gut metagenome]